MIGSGICHVIGEEDVATIEAQHEYPLFSFKRAEDDSASVHMLTGVASAEQRFWSHVRWSTRKYGPIPLVALVEKMLGHLDTPVEMALRNRCDVVNGGES